MTGGHAARPRGREAGAGADGDGTARARRTTSRPRCLFLASAAARFVTGETLRRRRRLLGHLSHAALGACLRLASTSTPRRPSGAARSRMRSTAPKATSNAYLVVMPDGRVVVNTGMGFEAGPQGLLRRGRPGPVRYVVLTQGHVDHVGGVDMFREPGTEVVAEANNPTQQAYDARLHRPDAARLLRVRRGDRRASAPQGGAVPVQSRRRRRPRHDRYAFDARRRPLRADRVSRRRDRGLAAGVAARERVCFTGNVFGALFGHFPNLVTIRGDRHRDALRYVETLDADRGSTPRCCSSATSIRSSGATSSAPSSRACGRAVLYVHDAVVAAMNEGKDVWTAMRESALPPELEVGEGYGKVAWSARAIWETYQGWFHGRRPPSSTRCRLERASPSWWRSPAGPTRSRARPREGEPPRSRRCISPRPRSRRRRATRARSRRAWPRTGRLSPRASTSGRRAGSSTRSARSSARGSMSAATSVSPTSRGRC